MKTSENVDKILPAFKEFQQTVNNPKKTKEGYGYKYAPLDDVINAIKEAMGEHGLAFNQEVKTNENGNIQIITNIFHTSGQWLSFGPLNLPPDSGKKRSEVQALGSAITYGRRYSLSATTGIASEEDDGASRKSGNNRSRSKKKKGKSQYNKKKSKSKKSSNKNKTKREMEIAKLVGKDDDKKAQVMEALKFAKENQKNEVRNINDLSKEVYQNLIDTLKNKEEDPENLGEQIEVPF